MSLTAKSLGNMLYFVQNRLLQQKLDKIMKDYSPRESDYLHTHYAKLMHSRMTAAPLYISSKLHPINKMHKML